MNKKYGNILLRQGDRLGVVQFTDGKYIVYTHSSQDSFDTQKEAIEKLVRLVVVDRKKD